MTTGYFIAGAVFLLLSIVWYFIETRSKKNAKRDKAVKDAKDAVDRQNTPDFIDGLRRRVRHKRKKGS